MKTKKGSGKKFLSLSPAERDREVAKFDQEIDIEKETKQLTAKQQAMFDRWQGSKLQKQQITVELDAINLRRCQAYAKKKKMTLSQVIERGIRGVLAFSD